jgi:hypothetical protein
VGGGAGAGKGTGGLARPKPVLLWRVSAGEKSEQPQLSKARAAAAAEDQVVDERAVERLGRAGQPDRRALVRLAGRRIAAWVVMRKDEAGAAVERRIGDDRVEREIRAGRTAVMVREPKAVRMAIEVCDRQAFASGIGLGKAAGKECAGDGETVELQRKFGTLMAHARMRYRRGAAERIATASALNLLSSVMESAIAERKTI